MQPESLIQLIGSGNATSVEEEWMRVVESEDLPLEQLSGYEAVLAELKRLGRASQAESLAWTALEALTSRHSPADILQVAGAFLLAAGESAVLRQHVTELYRRAHSGAEGLEELLQESGIAGGRPVRRALRTLDVCLALQEGGYLTGRDEDAAARVTAIDRSSWQFTITARGRQETLGAVHLADAYQPASPTDFHVLRDFAREQLLKRLEKDPGGIVVDLCRRQGNKVDSTFLERLLVPTLFSPAEWKKWWPRARAALKRFPNVSVEGRAPYTMTYIDSPASHENALLADFDAERDPLEQLQVLELYVRDCKGRREAVSSEALRRCHEVLKARAERLSQQQASAAALAWVVALRAGRLAGSGNMPQAAIHAFQTSTELVSLFQLLDSEPLVECACDCLVAARSADWRKELLTTLPVLPLAACDRVAMRLIEAGCSLADFAPAVQQIIAAPVMHFDALLWLWDGTVQEASIHSLPLINIFTRILRALEESRRSDEVSKGVVKKITTRARAVLTARRYERFIQCLQGLEPGVVLALKTQISRGEALGRAVREDLLKIVRGQFPLLDVQRPIDPWNRTEVLFVTQAGLGRKQEEIEQHVNVKMKENARAIGAAAAHGDLSENSEYKFALEERDLLRARLAQMNAEVAMAMVFNPEDVPTEFIGIGTKAVFRRVTDGQEYTMTFVGPWEADLAKGLFNYKAPLPQKVMGKRVGDEVDFDHTGASGTYRITSLHNSLLELDSATNTDVAPG